MKLFLVNGVYVKAFGKQEMAYNAVFLIAGLTRFK